MRKIKYILILLFIVIFGIMIIYKSINNNNSDTNVEISSSEMSKGKITIQNSPISIIEITKLILNKNSDWSNLPLSDNFKNKYNSKDGALGNIQFDKVEISPYHDGKYPFEDYAYFVITKGNKETAYEYDFKLDSTGQLIDDIKIIDVHNITDEYGNELDSRVAINEENFNRAFYMLSRGAEDEHSIAVTERFHSKYPYFLDLFEHYSPLGANTISFDSTKSSWENKEAYFIVDSRLECKKREYIVNFTLDVKGYLDDAVAKCINIEKYERTSLNYPYDNVLYKNSDWTNLKMTDKFKSKYNSKDGCLPNIDNIDVTAGLIGGDAIDLYTMIYGYVLKNGSYMWYCVRFINDENGYLDDIEFIPIDYNGIDAKEAKEIYLKEH